MSTHSCTRECYPVCVMAKARDRMDAAATHSPLPTMTYELDATCTSASCWHRKEGTYTLSGACSNCGARIGGTFTKGHAALDGGSGAVCPRCGVRRIRWERP